MRISTPILAVVLLFSMPVVGQEGSLDDLDPVRRLDALLEKIQEQQQNLHTLSASFSQRRTSPLLLDAEESSGVFYFEEPDRVRWDYHQPDPIDMVIRGEQMTTWYRDLDRADRIQIGGYSDKVLEYLGASGSLETLFRYFTVTAAFPEDDSQPYRLELEPRSGRVAKRIAGMTLWVDRELFLPTGILYIEPDGSETEYRFEDLKVNEELMEGLFDLELPEGTQVREIDLARGGT